MSSAHPDSGIPAPTQHEVPLSAAEATRLLDSIRQAEEELAETGEHIAVSPAEPVSAPTESDHSGATAGSETDPDDPDAGESAVPVASFSSEIVVEIDPDAGEPGTEFAAEGDSDAAAAGADVASGTTGGLILPGDVASDLETIVHVMRHGEVHNPKGILYGRLPGFQLSVTGRAQAQAVARSLADHDIALVVASPLQRAQETADPIAAGHGLVIRTDDNLIEAGNTFEGLRVSAGDGALRKPRHWWKLRDPFTPSWGEPYLQIAHRMLAAVNKARVEAAGREAVLVSHQLPVWTLRRFLQGQRLWHDPRHRQCSLASLTSLVYQGDTLIDIVYSEPAGASDPKVTGA